MSTHAQLGWLQDTPDQRDHPYVAPAGLVKKLPATVDLRPQCPPVLHQGKLNACTAHALANAHLFDQTRQRLPAPFPPSRLFIYWNERVALGTRDSDSGATIRGGIKAIARFGACPETLWAYDPAILLRQPGAHCFTAAAPHRAVAYKRIPRDIDLMRACLAEGWPFSFGFHTFAALHSAQVEQTGVLPMPRSDESPVGGHAVLAVGYDTTARTILAMNSWGADWGQAGFLTLPWDYLLHENLSHDFWTLRAVAGVAGMA